MCIFLYELTRGRERDRERASKRAAVISLKTEIGNIKNSNKANNLNKQGIDRPESNTNMSTVESSSSAVQQPPSSTLPMLGDNQVSTMQLQMQASTSSAGGSSSMSVGVPLDTQSSGEPPAKKQLLDPNAASSSSSSLSGGSGGGGGGSAGTGTGTNEKLAYRISTALCCAVCLDLPKTAMYQVSQLKPMWPRRRKVFS